MKKWITIFFLFIVANTITAQEIAGPFQIELKVFRKNVNRTDCFYDEINYDNPKRFQLTIYNYAKLESINIRKINIYSKPVGSDANLESIKGTLPFIKYFEFKIQPINYVPANKTLKVQIDFIVDEFIKFESNKMKQLLERSFFSVCKNIPLGKPFEILEINSTDSLHYVTIEIYNKYLPPPFQLKNDQIQKLIPADLLKVENSIFPPIHWRILHLVTDNKIDKKFWLDEKVAWAFIKNNENFNFSHQTLVSKLEYIFPERNEKGDIEIQTIFIPRKVIGREIEFTLLLFTKPSIDNENNPLLYRKDISIKNDEPLEIEVEFFKNSPFRTFFYITAYFNEDLKKKYRH
ncbi:MAG: hypothetical protein ACOY90_19115 [Candidatus Zhuqueibacterota bacterium]